MQHSRTSGAAAWEAAVEQPLTTVAPGVLLIKKQMNALSLYLRTARC
jgi:hypothetical protein